MISWSVLKQIYTLTQQTKYRKLILLLVNNIYLVFSSGNVNMTHTDQNALKKLFTSSEKKILQALNNSGCKKISL